MGLFDLFKKKDNTNINEDLVGEWIDEGKKLIYPEKYEKWEKFVYRASEGKYFGLEVLGVLTIMRELETGMSISEVLDVISNDPIAKDYMRSDIRNRVFEFSKRGPEFLEAVLGSENINGDLKQKIEGFRVENSKLEEKYFEKKQKN